MYVTSDYSQNYKTTVNFGKCPEKYNIPIYTIKHAPLALKHGATQVSRDEAKAREACEKQNDK